MGKKSKSKPSSEEEGKVSDSSDIFKILFGREAPQEQGLGLGLESNPRNEETKLQREIDTKEANTDSGDLKSKKKKRENSHLDANSPDEDLEKLKKRIKRKKKESIDEEEEEKVKKIKRKNEVKPDSDVDLVVTDNNQEIAVDVVPIVENGLERGDKKKKKKKRKRDELEQAYETKTYGVVPNVEEGDKGRKVGDKRKAVDDPAELMLSKEGFDDETKLLRTIFVGNLPLKLKKKALLKEFSKFGEVDSVRIRSVPIVDSKTPRKGAIMKGKINESIDSVHAYIVFKDEKSAQASLSHNMAVVGGNHIRVDQACPPRKKMKSDSAQIYDNQKTVFVGNLPFDVKDEEIYQLFCGIDQLESNIEAVRVIRDPNSSIGKGIAYVLFKTKEAANQVIKKRHLKIRDRLLRLYHAKADATPSKKRNLQTTSADNSSGKRLAVTSSGSHQDKNQPKIKTVLTYQGLKASKSIQKKEGPKKDGFRPRTGEQGKHSPRAEVKQQRKNKRPAVAARKAKASKGVGASRQTGVKRKPESRTPDSFHRNKKARKS